MNTLYRQNCDGGKSPTEVDDSKRSRKMKINTFCSLTQYTISEDNQAKNIAGQWVNLDNKIYTPLMSPKVVTR